ncbi:MAG: DUF2239 family protein [Gemmatimonadales bacterium]
MSSRCIAFEGSRRLGVGNLIEVATLARAATDRPNHEPILVFDEETSQPVELDLRGTADQVAARYFGAGFDEALTASLPARRPVGRPRLGVVPREVTLLPRHWAWLGRQPGGASAALRRLVDQARAASGDPDRLRTARESAYRFMAAMAGNEAGFEEASRALFAGNRAAFVEHTATWAPDVRDHARRLAAAGLGGDA